MIDTSVLGIGMLSSAVLDSKVPINQGLLTPKKPVWILHGGDHFSVAFALSNPSTDKETLFELNHWNGLPPNGPKMSLLKINAIQGTTTTVQSI